MIIGIAFTLLLRLNLSGLSGRCVITYAIIVVAFRLGKDNINVSENTSGGNGAHMYHQLVSLLEVIQSIHIWL